jgi:hypothetical protein
MGMVLTPWSALLHRADTEAPFTLNVSFCSAVQLRCLINFRCTVLNHHPWPLLPQIFESIAPPSSMSWLPHLREHYPLGCRNQLVFTPSNAFFASACSYIYSHPSGGLYPISWGARWTPPVRKCHQMSSKEHMQLGWVVRWVLSTPPGPPHGWAVRPCRASTSLAPLYSPHARLAFGWGSKPPSRSALAPVGSSPGPVTHRPFHRLFILDCLSWLIKARAAK